MGSYKEVTRSILEKGGHEILGKEARIGWVYDDVRMWRERIDSYIKDVIICVWEHYQVKGTHGIIFRRFFLTKMQFNFKGHDLSVNEISDCNSLTLRKLLWWRSTWEILRGLFCFLFLGLIGLLWAWFYWYCGERVTTTLVHRHGHWYGCDPWAWAFSIKYFREKFFPFLVR